jgi:hypothetical protein
LLKWYERVTFPVYIMRDFLHIVTSEDTNLGRITKIAF